MASSIVDLPPVDYNDGNTAATLLAYAKEHSFFFSYDHAFEMAAKKGAALGELLQSLQWRNMVVRFSFDTHQAIPTRTTQGLLVVITNIVSRVGGTLTILGLLWSLCFAPKYTKAVQQTLRPFVDHREPTMIGNPEEDSELAKMLGPLLSEEQDDEDGQ